jgi:flavodoxin
MKAVVVYESLWGNTASIARAIAEGIGGGTKALSTAEATPETCAGADLIVRLAAAGLQPAHRADA